MWKSNRALRLRALELAVDVKKQIQSKEPSVTQLADGYYQFLRRGAVNTALPAGVTSITPGARTVPAGDVEYR